MKSHAAAIKRQDKHADLFIIYTASTALYTPEDKDSLRAEMFREIVARCATDVAGFEQMQEAPSEGGLRWTIDRLKGHAPMDYARLFIENLPGFTKGYVQTPHPTEVLSEKAIAAEGELMDALHAMPDLFADGNLQNVDGGKRAALVKALNNLYDALEVPLQKPLDISSEMKRSVRFSERMFDAIPTIAGTIFSALDAHSTQFKNEDLKQFFQLTHAVTWSPGDRDSKPDMTAEKLDEGIKLNKRAMAKHYFRYLAIHGAHALLGEKQNSDNNALKERLYEIMGNLIAAAHEQNGDTSKPLDRAYILHALIETTPSATVKDSLFIDGFLSYVEKAKEKGKLAPYKDAQNFLDDLFSIRKDFNKEYPSYKEGAISPLDGLIIQTGNFLNTALSIQIRHNQDKHTNVIEQVAELAGMDAAAIHTRQGVDTLIERLNTDMPFREDLRAKVQEKMAAIHASGHHQRDASGNITHKEDFDFYQTLEGMRLAAENPAAIPHYLIAECSSSQAILEAFALLQLMQKEVNPAEKVEIIPLVEYPAQAMEKNGKIPYAEMLKEAYENPYFSDHHRHLRQAEDPALADYSLDNGKQPLNVAEAKRRYGLAVKDGDEQKIIHSAKLAMGAGSDITKAGGAAAAALMQNATEKLRESLLDMKDPVLLIDYIGCGGGVHRSQPVSTAYETVQGRSMRQSPYFIAQKTINRLSHHLREKFAHDPAGGKSSLLGRAFNFIAAQINLGNLLGMPRNEQAWEQETQPRVHAWVEKYQELYHSEEFKELLGYSADAFAKLTSFAARPAVRESGKDTVSFPQGVEVEKLRAIGYGAALNAAGSCASLYYGASAFLKRGGEENISRLRTTYLGDPKAQDAINRATYGIVMADMKTAWRYLGEACVPNEQELKALASAETDSAKGKAAKALAMVTLEYNEVAQQLYKLHASLRPKAQTKDEPQTGEEAVARIFGIKDLSKLGNVSLSELMKDAEPGLLPSNLRNQLIASCHHIAKPRRALAEVFDKLVAEGKRPTRDSEEYLQTIYPAMGAIMECFEHAPRAYTTPAWGLQTEKAPSRLAA